MRVVLGLPLAVVAFVATAPGCDADSAAGHAREAPSTEARGHPPDVPSTQAQPASESDDDPGAPASRAEDEEAPAEQIPEPRAGHDRIGKPAPAWGDMQWIGAEPRSLEDLRGKVVLIRFWTSTCPYCEASAPAFREAHADYAAQGLVVLGFHHPKPYGHHSNVARVKRKVAEFGWAFPVALDDDWSALKRYWLSPGPHREATSVTFLLDRHGRIRWVHPGPELHPGGPADHAQCRQDYRDMRQAIEALL